MKIDRRFPPTWSADRERLYQREWTAVTRVDPHADRTALHFKALGYHKSHLDFTDIEFGKVLDVFRAISSPRDLLSQIEATDSRKRQLIFSIRRTAQKLKIDVAAVVEQPIEQLEPSASALVRSSLRENRVVGYFENENKNTNIERKNRPG